MLKLEFPNSNKRAIASHSSVYLAEKANGSDSGQVSGKTSCLYIISVTVRTFRLPVVEFSNMYEF